MSSRCDPGGFSRYRLGALNSPLFPPPVRSHEPRRAHALRRLAWLAPLALLGCESPKPARSAQTEMVPSNSAYEAAAAKPQVVKPAESPTEEPGGTGGGGAAPSGGGGGAAAGATTPSKGGSTVSAPLAGPAPTPGSPGAADLKNSKPPTRAECMQVIDRYVELEVQSNPALQGIPPEMLQQLLKTAKGQATAQKGDPCAEEKITRGKYNCAMAAPNRDAWKACMK